MPLPMIAESQVAQRPLSPVFQETSGLTPETFGGGVARAASGAGVALGRVAEQLREEKARRDSSSALLGYSTKSETLEAETLEKLKTISAQAGPTYDQDVLSLQEEYTKKVQGLREESSRGLSDSLAVTTFEIQSRIQTQATARRLGAAVLAQTEHRRKAIAESSLAQAEHDAGRVTGNATVDALNLGESAIVHFRAVEDYLTSIGTPKEGIAAARTKAEGAMANSALKAYGSNFAAGLAFLQTKIPGTDIRIGYDPQNPKGESILDGAETAHWVHVFTGHKTEKVGATLGEQLYQESRSIKGFNLERRLTALYQSKQYSPEDIGKARQQYTSAVSENNRLHDIAVGNLYESAFKLATTKYGGDVDLALRSGDESFARMWSAIGPQQGALRLALKKQEADDPKAYAGLGRVIDLSQNPGWSQKFASFQDFMARLQPEVGQKHWPAAVKLYEADVKRDTSQDVSYKFFKELVDMKVRVLTGWTHSDFSNVRNTWDSASPDQQSIYVLVSTMAEQAWVSRSQVRKETGGKISDASWASETVNEIIKQAEMVQKLEKNKRSKARTPPGYLEAGPTPPSALEVEAKRRLGAAMPSPKSQAEYDALPVGTTYIGPDGQIRQKAK